MALVNKEGKPIDTSGVDAKIVGLIESALDGVTAQVTAGTAESVSAAIAPITEKLEALGGFGEKLTELESKLGQAKPKDQSGGGDPKDQGKGGGASDELMQAIKDLAEKVNGIASEREAEKSQTATTQRVDAWLKQHRPNLPDAARARVRARVIAGNPADDKAVEAAVKDIQQEMADLGVKDVDTMFNADPKNEGGSAGAGDGTAEAKKQASLDQVKSRKPGEF